MSERLDGSFTIQDLKATVEAWYSARPSMNSYNHEPMYTEMALVLESAEVLEAAKYGLDIGQELCDVLIYVLCLASTNNIDLTTEVLAKLQKNNERFPAELFPGTADDFPRQYMEQKRRLGDRR